MNEIRFTAAIRRALDESAARLPSRVTQRLESARAAALAQVPASAGAAFAGRLPESRPGPGTGAGPLLARLAVVAVPLAALVGGLFLIDEIESRRHAVETAEVEAAVLTDLVPIAAYVDRGFGVYLKNSQQ